MPAMEVLGGRESSGGGGLGGIDPAMTGSGCVDLDPLIPPSGVRESHTKISQQKRSGHARTISTSTRGLNTHSTDDNGGGALQDSTSVLSEVTNSVVLPPR